MPVVDPLKNAVDSNNQNPEMLSQDVVRLPNIPNVNHGADISVIHSDTKLNANSTTGSVIIVTNESTIGTAEEAAKKPLSIVVYPGAKAIVTNIKENVYLKVGAGGEFNLQGHIYYEGEYNLVPTAGGSINGQGGLLTFCGSATITGTIGGTSPVADCAIAGETDETDNPDQA